MAMYVHPDVITVNVVITLLLNPDWFLIIFDYLISRLNIRFAGSIMGRAKTNGSASEIYNVQFWSMNSRRVRQCERI